MGRDQTAWSCSLRAMVACTLHWCTVEEHYKSWLRSLLRPVEINLLHSSPTLIQLPNYGFSRQKKHKSSYTHTLSNDSLSTAARNTQTPPILRIDRFNESKTIAVASGQCLSSLGLASTFWQLLAPLHCPACIARRFVFYRAVCIPTIMTTTTDIRTFRQNSSRFASVSIFSYPHYRIPRHQVL